MADLTTVPLALFDYVLYYECAKKDWANYSAKSNIKGDGSLMNAINWNSTYSYDPNDSGGKTLFGITEKTWQSYVKNHPSSGFSSNLNSMGRKGFEAVVAYFWNDYSCGGKSANYACAFALFQMAWGGFSSENQQKLINTLRTNADKKDYKFKSGTKGYSIIADATHAYSDPMLAYNYIRRAKSSYLFNISTPGKKNHRYRMGWMRRNVLAFTPHGLFIDDGASYKKAGLTESSTVANWESVAMQWAQENKSGYKKIFDWGASPESIASMSVPAYDPSFGGGGDAAAGMGGVSMGPRVLYSGCAGVYNLGDYTNSPDMTIIPQQTQNREEVLNTLMSGSYTPDEVSKCAELITVDKKKNVKIKRENSEDSKKTDAPTKTETPTKAPTKTDNKEDTKKSKK